MKMVDFHTFQFGNFVLEASQHSLKKGTQQIHLRPKAFETLLYLVKHHGSLVKKQDMLDDLWPNVIVTENTLSHCIDEVRRVLQDDAQEPTFIRTIPRVGFKFIAVVKELKTDENKTVIDDSEVDEQRGNIQSEAIVNQEKNPTGKKRILVGMIVIILITLLTVIIFSLLYDKSKKINSIAVLPFINLNVEPEEEYFADGMTETLISNLGKVKSLKVISRTSVMTYKNASNSLPEIARQLNVDAIVEGSVLNANGHVRVTAKLIMANTDKLLWVKSYKRDLKDIMKLQGELANEITSEIKLELTPEEHTSVTASKSVNPKAYIAYLKGRYFWNMRTSEGFEKAKEQFLKAIAIDSGYAPTYSGLSDTYILQGNYGIIPSHEATLKAKKYVTKALELDNTLAEAHVSLSACLYNEWNIAGAQKELERAIKLNPNYATAHQWYAFLLVQSGRMDEGIIEMKKAMELSPLSLRIQVDVGRAYFWARQYDKAISQYKEALELNSNFPPAHSLLGLAYLKKGNNENAITELKKGMELGKSTISMWLGYAYALAGDTIKANSFLKVLVNRWNEWHDGAEDIALIYEGFNNKVKALEWLKKAFDERNIELLSLKVDPLWDTLRSNPYFQDLLENIEIQVDKSESKVM